MKSLFVTVCLLASSVAMAYPSNKLCEGNRVIDTSGTVGKVIEVFDNGKAKVLFDDYNYYSIQNINDLGKGVHCKEHICVDNRVIDKSGTVGRVVEVFDNGKAKVLFDDYNYYSIQNINDLGKGFACIDSLCQGNRIVDQSNSVGETIEVFDNGLVKVLFDNDNYYSIRSFNALGIGLKCRMRENCSLLK